MNQAKKIFDQAAELFNEKKYLEVHNLLVSNFDILLNYEPLQVMNLHLSALIKGKIHDLAHAGIAAYRSLATDDEEFIKAIKLKEKQLNLSMKKTVAKAFLDDGELKNKLNSKDTLQIMIALRLINENESLHLYSDDLNAILMDETFHGSQKSLILASLQSFGYDKQVTMIRYGQYFEYIPKDLPSLEPAFGFIDKVESIINSKNVSVIIFTKQIIEMYELAIYPETCLSDDHQKYVVLVASYLIACQMFNEPPPLKDELIKKYNLNEAEVVEMRKSIEIKTAHTSL